MILLLLSFSCNGQKVNKQKSFNPDISISKISLLDTVNITSFLGKDVMLKLKRGIIKSASFSNLEQDQTLEVFFHPGSHLNEFSEFRVFKSKNENDTSSIKIQNFITESGVLLGIDISNLIEIKGIPSSKRFSESFTVYEYVIDDYTTSHFLKKYTRPIYYARYFFENRKLVRFEFGFGYP